ncbi:MAG: hypothetical protein K9L62_10450 [Vallitaleaceae bacterium]|nr:hypothetical protein [Vallitaleaceae bacterium]
MKSTDQKLIMINGIVNSGKTLLFNLFKIEGNFICMDLTKEHFHIYKNDLINDLGKENVKRLKPLIESTKIYDEEILLREIGLLMKFRPSYHFVIKPMPPIFAKQKYIKFQKFEKWVKEYTPLKMENLHNLMVFRHPYLSWLTVPLFRTNIDNQIETWLKEIKEIDNIFWEAFDIVKLEDIKDHELIKNLIKKTDLNKVKSYTNFDLHTKELNDYIDIEKDLKKIEKKLKPLFDKLDYDNGNKYIKMFMKDYLTDQEKKFFWLDHL